MNITAFFLSLLLVAALSCVGQNTTNKKTNPEVILPTHGFCAHRGAMQTHPENTLPAFQAAINAGAHMIELDVWLTKDGQMVVIHDNTVDRTTNGSGKIADLTLPEIKKLDAGSWKSPSFKEVRVPTFEEALKVMPRNVWLNIHMKEGNEAPALVAEVLKKENRLHQAFLACGVEAAKKAREKVPEILICNMDRQNSTEDYVNTTIHSEADFIQLSGDITPDFQQHIQRLKQKNIRVNYFGSDSPEEIKLLFQYQVDFPLVNDIVHTIQLGKDFGITPVQPEF
ncbi:glycerophosphodiester phosphodiesterase family protein [Maribellus sp. CM-23]|uniref:glycerophosphodiester phosphodiesterase n=1 Tax=Maribellus sp. CM-23 TaxID=2781026 RepID=UPI001F3FE8F5|nr:glycerophosphodiester phosphodiesterase family protein [Maribellus sp. CM-23]MCE4562840.1 glycerophosphodiester phosphodiesterase family protein [Maribellus sp. CM-23]